MKQPILLQLHLSTAVALMLLASTFVLMNSIQWWGTWETEWNNPLVENLPSSDVRYRRYGFPRALWMEETSGAPAGFQRFVGPDGIVLDLPQGNTPFRIPPSYLPREIHFSNACFNISLALIVMLFIWAVMEWDIRRIGRERGTNVIAP